MHRDWSFRSNVEARCRSPNIWVSSETNSCQLKIINRVLGAKRKGWNQDAAASVRYEAANMTCASSLQYLEGSALKVSIHCARNSWSLVGSVPANGAGSLTFGPHAHSTKGAASCKRVVLWLKWL